MSLQEAEKMKDRIPAGWTLESMKREASELECVVILHTGWYPEVMEPMLASAKKYLSDVGVPSLAVKSMAVPGSFELPLAAASCISALKPAFVIALGCVVKGETPHFDFVCSAVSSGLMKVQLKKKTPVGFGVLTVATLDQALARQDKGAEAAQAAFLMHLFQKRLED